MVTLYSFQTEEIEITGTIAVVCFHRVRRVLDYKYKICRQIVAPYCQLG